MSAPAHPSRALHHEVPGLKWLFDHASIRLPLVGRQLRMMLGFHSERWRAGPCLVLSRPTLASMNRLGQQVIDRHVVEEALPWAMGIDRSKAPKRLDHLWIFGTAFYDELSEAQRVETAWLETARDLSLLIAAKRFSSWWVGQLDRWAPLMPTELQDHLLRRCQQDVYHTQVLRRFMGMAGLPCMASDPGQSRSAALLSRLHPCAQLLAHLLVEWMIDTAAMQSTQTPGIDPLTQRLFQVLHRDQGPYLAISKGLVEDYLHHLSPKQRHEVQAVFNRLIPPLFAAFRFDPAIAAHTSFSFPVTGLHHESVRAVRESAYNQRLDDVRFRGIRYWLWSVGAI